MSTTHSENKGHQEQPCMMGDAFVEPDEVSRLEVKAIDGMVSVSLRSENLKVRLFLNPEDADELVEDVGHASQLARETHIEESGGTE